MKVGEAHPTLFSFSLKTEILRGAQNDKMEQGSILS